MLIHTLRANIFKTEAKLEEIGEHARVISVVKLTCKNIKLYTDGRWGTLTPFRSVLCRIRYEMQNETVHG